MRRLVLLVIAVLTVAGCGEAASPAGDRSAGVITGSASPHATTTTTAPPTLPPGAVALRVWQLRYLLLRHYPDFAFCDPDYYPVARDDEQSASDGWWTGADHTSPEVVTILNHLGLRAPLAPDQRLSAYRDHKKLTVIVMTQVAGGYEYELSTSRSAGEPDQSIVGIVTLDGEIRERTRRERPGGCPICLDAGTLIAAPGGDLPIALIRPGDVVWTTDSDGRRLATPVLRVARRSTPGAHLMLRLALADGRVLVAAGAHPTADGRYLRQLRTGQRYDGAAIVSIGWIASTAPKTFDILPAGPSGNYLANGILVGSTLSAERVELMGCTHSRTARDGKICWREHGVQQ